MITLDPSKLEPVLAALDAEELRVFAWLLALVDEDGALIGAEMRLARRSGLGSPAQLRPVLDRLASVRFGAAPLLARDLVHGRPRLRLVGPPGLVRHHGRSAAVTSSEPAPVPTTTAMRNRRRATPPQNLLEVRARRAHEVELFSPVLAQLAESWLAMLAAYAPDGQLTLIAQVRQYDVIFELATTYGVDATEAAFIAGERIIETGGGPKGRPESLLRKLARDTFEQARTGNPARAFAERGRPAARSAASRSAPPLPPEAGGPGEKPELAPETDPAELF